MTSSTYKMNLLKLEHYCALQDRCIFEVKQKMYRMQFPQADHDRAIEHLINESFIDHERYAESFVRGKFRIKQWGKVKIAARLRQLGVEDKYIEKALNSINGLAYKETCVRLLRKRLKGKSQLNKKEEAGIIRFMQQRGFELSLVFEELNMLKDEIG